jgi:hypothetical protein
MARNPDCENCEIKADCPAGRQALNPKLTAEKRKKLRMRI